MKTVCIYHKNCFDGICAAWVVSKMYPSAELRAFSYDMEFPWHEYGKDDNIIIVDFSFKRDIMLAIKEQCNRLLVLDHHKTAQANCEGLDFCKFDMNESGASLAWNFFFPNHDIPNLIKYIKDRDLWRFNEPNSESVNSFIQSYPMDIQTYEGLYQRLESYDGLKQAKATGDGILRYKQTMVETICKNAAFQEEIHYPHFPYGVPIVNTSILFSEVGHKLCKLYPDAPFTAYYFDRLNDAIRQWGLRSIGDFDVSEIAKKFGGGGHRNAAGFEQKLSVL